MQRLEPSLTPRGSLYMVCLEAHFTKPAEALTSYIIIIEYRDFAMNQNILIVANESVQTQGILRGLRGVGLPAHLLPDARSTLALLKIRVQP